jgi:hypothetical protein
MQVYIYQSSDESITIYNSLPSYATLIFPHYTPGILHKKKAKSIKKKHFQDIKSTYDAAGCCAGTNVADQKTGFQVVDFPSTQINGKADAQNKCSGIKTGEIPANDCYHSVKFVLIIID